jgi:hypothetical protein
MRSRLTKTVLTDYNMFIVPCSMREIIATCFMHRPKNISLGATLLILTFCFIQCQHPQCNFT